MARMLESSSIERLLGECIGDRRLKLRKFEVVRRGDDIYVAT